MRIAILSDSHDQIVHLHRAVQLANDEGAEILVHCGDLISPFMLAYLAKFTGPVHLIYGNNAGDQHLISTRCESSLSNIHHHGIFGSVTAGNLLIGFHHYPELARGLAESGEYDIVCCGHNHICSIEHINGCLFINPGDLLGKDAPPGFVLYDTDQRSVHHITVGLRMNFTNDFTPSRQRLFATAEETPGNNAITGRDITSAQKNHE